MPLSHTPLHDHHVKLGGRMVPFAGWEMPVQYASIVQEHVAVRNNAGLFDVSHMGEIIIIGADSLALLEKVTCNTVSKLSDGQVQYNAVLNQAGGIIDDVTIYRVHAEEYFVVSNASNYERVYLHLTSFGQSMNADCKVTNESTEWHQIAIQGPSAEAILDNHVSGLSDIGYFRFADLDYNGKRVRISRTGYTGEDGFEVYSEIETGVALWKALLDQGKDAGLVPVGLGARDTLRLEAMYPLYGHELNDQWSPVESGIGWIVKEKSDPYLGYDRIMDHKQNGPPGRVVPLIQEGRGGVPRDGYAVLDTHGKEIGKICSGSHSPSLKKGIATAYLPVAHTEVGTPIQIDIRGRPVDATVAKGPFVKGTAGQKRNNAN